MCEIKAKTNTNCILLHLIYETSIISAVKYHITYLIWFPGVSKSEEKKKKKQNTKQRKSSYLVVISLCKIRISYLIRKSIVKCKSAES